MNEITLKVLDEEFSKVQLIKNEKIAKIETHPRRYTGRFPSEYIKAHIVIEFESGDYIMIWEDAYDQIKESMIVGANNDR